MCKHQWEPIIPSPVGLEIKDPIGYGLFRIIKGWGDMFYCKFCFRTSHKIKSHRGGHRLHTPEGDESILKRANEFRESYGLNII